MGAIRETEPGGELVCILEFSARPRDEGQTSILGARRVFRIGERVRLLDHFDKRSPEDNPTGMMAVFEPLDGDGNRYAATESYFVTPDCWEGLRHHFATKVTIPHVRTK